MNFIEAVQALKDGRCEGIRRESWRGVHDDFLQLQDGWLVWNYSNIEKVAGKRMILADDWQLVGEKPLTEEVEVVRWAVIAPSGFCEATYASEPLANAATRTHQYLGYTVAKLTGHYTRPVTRKVKRREVLGVYGHYSPGADSSGVPYGARVIAEWEEKSP